MVAITIRTARDGDRRFLRDAVFVLQEHERALHDSRRPGEAVAEAYRDWMLGEAARRSGAVFIAEADGVPAGFVACWVAEEESIAETPDSCRFGYVSDICILPQFRRLGIARDLLAAAERHLAAEDVTRLRLNALAGNHSAIATYESSGYAPYEIRFEKRVAGDFAQ